MNLIPANLDTLRAEVAHRTGTARRDLAGRTPTRSVPREPERSDRGRTVVARSRVRAAWALLH